MARVLRVLEVVERPKDFDRAVDVSTAHLAALRDGRVERDLAVHVHARLELVRVCAPRLHAVISRISVHVLFTVELGDMFASEFA